MTNHGHFSDNPQTEWASDVGAPDRDMVLLRDFWYEDPDGHRWDAPMGSRINGASIPRPLWSTVGSPYTDDYRCASIVHDVACDRASTPVERKAADKMFYFACRGGGCSRAQARMLYLGVRIGAWGSDLSGFMPALARTSLLYRLPGAPKLPAESLVLGTFGKIAEKLSQLDESAGFAELEALVDAELEQESDRRRAGEAPHSD